MASTCNRPYSNKLGDHKIKLIWLALYYGLAIHLPGSYSFMGKLFRAKAIRYALCRRIFLKCGKNVNIEHGCNFGSGLEIEIGDNVGISGATIYARKKITIGENTCIGGNCKILDNDFHPIEAETRNKLLRDENGGDSDLVPSREIKIGKNCFIGCNSIILKGTVLGDGCVVGAGAVVAGKFEANCVIAGNPAKVIKRLEEKN